MDELEKVDVVEEPIDEVKVEPEKIEEVEKPKDQIPLYTYLELKNQNRELKKEALKYQTQQEELNKKERIAKIKQIALDNNIDNGVADALGKMFEEVIKGIPVADMETAAILDEIEDYAETNPSVMSVKKDVLEKVKRYRRADPDFTVEDAFRLIRPSKTSRELTTEAEQKAALARRSGKEPPVTSSASVESKYPLTDDEKRIVREMQKHNPEGNWTNEKYFKLLKSKRR